ncbi:Peptidase S24-like [Pseudomonas cedrina]|uniref:Peptidase S24-like n=3 Tax=Gammaproteobacteria TaxID=1236 RepID=A0ABY0U2L7_PSECE|nr:Peptidase S24-like [Pseudomonas cedrina]
MTGICVDIYAQQCTPEHKWAYQMHKYANQHLPTRKSPVTIHIMQKRNVSIVLRELLDRDRISPTELHRRTGVPQSTLSRILSGKIVDPSDKHISRIAEYFRVSTDQLRGRVVVGALRDDGRDPMHSELKDISLWDDDTPVNDDEVSIPFLREVELAAGSGRFVIEESEKASLRFGKRSLRHNGVQFDQAKCVTVRGNSMLPVLRDGATVGVNAGKSAIGDIVDGDLYAINHNGQLRVKQLYRLPSGIRLRSFNREEHPDEDYSFQDIQDEQISILGHVFWWGMYAR